VRSFGAGATRGAYESSARSTPRTRRRRGVRLSVVALPRRAYYAFLARGSVAISQRGETERGSRHRRRGVMRRVSASPGAARCARRRRGRASPASERTRTPADLGYWLRPILGAQFSGGRGAALRSLRLRRSRARGEGRRPPCTPSSVLDFVHSGCAPVLAKASPLAIRGAAELDGRRPRLRYRGCAGESSETRLRTDRRPRRTSRKSAGSPRRRTPGARSRGGAAPCRCWRRCTTRRPPSSAPRGSGRASR
jgi:hypothetical protein